MASIQDPMNNIHMLAIQYLAYLVINKQKLGNEQAPISPLQIKPPATQPMDNKLGPTYRKVGK